MHDKLKTSNESRQNDRNIKINKNVPSKVEEVNNDKIVSISPLNHPKNSTFNMFEISKFNFPIYANKQDLTPKLMIINQQLKEKLNIYEVKYREVIDDFTKLQSICKELESFYLVTFNSLFKK